MDGVDDSAPASVGTERLQLAAWISRREGIDSHVRVSYDHERVLRSRQGYVHAVGRLEEADLSDGVGAGGHDDDDVRLGALENSLV